MHSIVAQRKRGARPSPTRLEELRQRSIDVGASGYQVYTAVTLAYGLVEQERYAEALESMQSALTDWPSQIELQAEWADLIQSMSVQALGLAAEAPHTLEFYQLYLKLRALGESPIRCHLGAVEYLRTAGQLAEAKDLAQRLYAVAPGLRGLRPLAEQLAMTIPHETACLPAKTLELPDASLSLETLRLYQMVIRAYQSNDFSTVLQVTESTLSKLELSPTQRDAFGFYHAAALDASGNPLDALPFFLSYLEKYPANPRAHEALASIVESLSRQIAPIVHEQPTNPILVKYAIVMRDTDICPWWLFRASAKLRAQSTDPRVRQEAKLELQAHLKLSPNDPDYLSGALEVASLLGDAVWLEELAEQATDLSQSLPFSLKHRELRSKLEKSEPKIAA